MDLIGAGVEGSGGRGAAGWAGRAVARLGGVHDVGAGAAPARRAVMDRADALFDRAGPARAPSDPRAGAPARENGVNPAVHQDGELDGAPARENGG